MAIVNHTLGKAARMAAVPLDFRAGGCAHHFALPRYHVVDCRHGTAIDASGWRSIVRISMLFEKPHVHYARPKLISEIGVARLHWTEPRLASRLVLLGSVVAVGDLLFVKQH